MTCGSSETEEATYEIDDGVASTIHDVCIASDALAAGFVITAGGGDWDNEISWQLLDADGSVIASGDAGEYQENCE